MDELFEAIREQAGKEIWSRGVELARQDAVSGERSSATEIVLRVFDRSKGVSAIITLWPKEADWSRDCSCKLDPCHHVAAAMIALRRAQEQGTVLPTNKASSAKLLYSLRRHQGFLDFERFVLHEGGRELLNVPLNSLSTGHWGQLNIAPTQVDLAIESVLGSMRRGRLKAAVMVKLLPLLSEVAFSLDESPCAIQKEALGLTILIRDEGLGIHVMGKRDPRIVESFHNGAVLSAEGLHPQADLQLDPIDLDVLRLGKTINLRDLERFASEKLPRWQGRFKIENRATNLPEFVEAEPDIELQFERRGDGLVVRPTLVYGDPPIARIAEGVFRPLGKKVPVRDHDAERRLKDQLWRQWGFELYHDRYLPAEEAIRVVETLKGWSGPQQGRQSLEDFHIYQGLQAEVNWLDGRLEIQWSLPLGDQALDTADKKTKEASNTALLRAWEQGQSLVPLLEGGFASMPVDWLQRYGATMRELLAAQEARETLPRASQLQALQLMQDLGLTIPSELQTLAKLQALNWDSLQYKQPAAFTATLRPYQEKGVAWLQHMQTLELGALLADDMGLGKTVQTIAVLARGSLIIAPTSVLPNWKKELQRFRPNLRLCLYHGSQRQFDPTADIVLSSYGLLRQDQEFFTGRRWTTIVLDEAQMIKNPESKLALAAQQLQAGFRLALSGTPVENRLDDLWSIFAFLNPGLLGSRKDFRERWSRLIEEGQETVAQRLRQLLRPFVLRRLKRDVAPELPPRIEKLLYSELWPEERRLYEAIFAASRQDLVEKLQAGTSIFEVLEALLRMRQACCHPALIPSQHAVHSSKLTLLVETLGIALAEGHKALVFSQWTSLLDLLEPQLQAAGIKFLRLDGSTRDRQAVVDQFQAEAGPPVLIMSLKAGGVGLNLTRADHVFILDPWWNPAAADQAADRAHRIGQDRTVIIHPMVALDTIEEKIMELQQQKRALAAAALGEGKAVPALSRDDLLYLLSQ